MALCPVLAPWARILMQAMMSQRLRLSLSQSFYLRQATRAFAAIPLSKRLLFNRLIQFWQETIARLHRLIVQSTRTQYIRCLRHLNFRRDHILELDVLRGDLCRDHEREEGAGRNESATQSTWHAITNHHPNHRHHPSHHRPRDRKSTRLNSSHVAISYAVFCLKQ